MTIGKEDIDFFRFAFKELDTADLFKLFELSQTRKIQSGEVYIAEGSISKKLGYIKKGLLRTYLLKPNGDEITLMLRWENQFIAPIECIRLHQSSRFVYQAMEDTVLLEVNYDKVQPIINNCPNLSSSRNNFVLDMLVQAMDRIVDFLVLSPEERYVKLLKENPDITNRVPGKYLATMLGITPVSLSRIRGRIAYGGR